MRQFLIFYWQHHTQDCDVPCERDEVGFIVNIIQKIGDIPGNPDEVGFIVNIIHKIGDIPGNPDEVGFIVNVIDIDNPHAQQPVIQKKSLLLANSF